METTTAKTPISKNWLWGVLFLVFMVGKCIYNSKKESGNRSSSSSSSDITYYKWPCKFCGKRLPLDEFLTPNQGIYTPENGYVFCSQECWQAFRSLGK